MMLQLALRRITLDHARTVFKEAGLGVNSKQDLKKGYLMLAKKYHPDTRDTGNQTKFVEVRDAYERLLQEKDGFTLSEEDLFQMYTAEQDKKAYVNSEELRKQFEQWKRSTTTQYSKEKHDDFLRNRYYKQSQYQSTEEHFTH